MVQLSNLKSSGKERKRIGRGGSRGGTSGKGHKGQRARTSGNVRIGFEGGQMPLVRRLPKRGFNNAMFKKHFEIISLKALDAAFTDGEQVTRDALVEKGLFKKHVRLFKVLGGDSVSKKLDVHAHAFSASAQEAIAKAGGNTTLISVENIRRTRARHNDLQ